MDEIQSTAVVTINTYQEDKSIGELLSTGYTQVVKMRGNFWKSFGFNKQGNNYLLPEEALYLFERGIIIIECSGERLLISELYEITLKYISINCYLAYSKLKVRFIV